MAEEDERATEVVVVERGHPVVLALLDEYAPLTIAIVLALVSYAAVELVNWHLGDPLGAHQRWASGPHNGNHRLRGAWFFAVVGLWLYPASVVLAALAARRAVGATRNAARAAWLLVGVTLLVVLLRLMKVDLVTATLGLAN